MAESTIQCAQLTSLTCHRHIDEILHQRCHIRSILHNWHVNHLYKTPLSQKVRLQCVQPSNERSDRVMNAAGYC